ncbi:MAG: phosphodiester glycosidase family protein [Clostridia bacterium]|nr:phosphodiester glycosidase family protein [Clostridia bacterium]
MKKAATRFLAVILAVIMTVACVPSGAVYEAGDTVATYTVTSAEVHNLGDGLVYNEYRYNDSKGIGQVCFTMEFNPSSSDFRSYVYHSKASHGYTIVDDVKNAQAEGLEVYAAINGDFFSMDANNYGTPIGHYGSAGKVTVGDAGLECYNLVIDKNGKADVVYSKLVYGLNIGGADYSNKLTAINKRATSYNANYIYYFDSDIGATSPVPAIENRTELVCDITEGKLSVGGTLKGNVKEIRTTSGGAIGENQFVLSAGTGVDVSSVSVGTEVVLTVAESVEASKETMENAYHFIYAHQTMKVDGYDRWANGDLVNPGLSEQYAQRCVVGIKEDGTIIYFVCDGRKTGDAGTNGFDYDMIMEIMAPYNCTDIINFDGGGSTAVVVGESDGKFSYEFIGGGTGTGRAVANSILIVRDPDAEPLPEESYEPIVDAEGTELRNVAINKPYTLEQYGSTKPTYLSTLQGDPNCKKLTNGKVRNAENGSEALSVVSIGVEHQLHMVMDLGQIRGDIRNITWRGVTEKGTRSFNTDNLIVYVSDDGVNFSKSIAGEVAKKDTGIADTTDVVYSFKEAQSGRYIKLVYGNTTNEMQVDEIEVWAMVDENEPIEEPLPEDITDLPAEAPSEACTNVALGKTYTITVDGGPIYSFYETSKDPRYYSALTADLQGKKLTDGEVGTEGTFNDNYTVGLRTGTSKLIEMIFDLGEVKENIEFVRLLHIIDNAGSFGKLDGADISFSTDGTNYTLASCRVNSEAVTNTHYHNLTLQCNELASARYVKVSFLTPKFLFAVGEIEIFTSPEDIDESSEESSVEESSEAPVESSEAPIESSEAESSEDIEDSEVIESSECIESSETETESESSEASEPEESTEIESSDDIADVVYGDVNGDGNINSLDAAQVLRYDAQLAELTEAALIVADVNGDGDVNSLDAAQILKFDAQLIESFPVEDSAEEENSEVSSVESVDAIISEEK